VSASGMKKCKNFMTSRYFGSNCVCRILFASDIDTYIICMYVCMCVCIYAHMCVCIYAHTNYLHIIYTYMCVCIYTYITCMYIYICTHHMCVSMWLCRCLMPFKLGGQMQQATQTHCSLSSRSGRGFRV